MLEIVLFRHGIAIDRADPACPDESDRALTEKGIEKTRASARGLLSMGVVVDQVISSTYRRAIETAEVAMEQLDLGPDVLEIRDGLLPFDAPQRIFDEFPQFIGQQVMIVGHAPHLDHLLALAVGRDDPFTQLRKAGAAKLTFHEPSARRAELDWLLPAGALRAHGG